MMASQILRMCSTYGQSTSPSSKRHKELTNDQQKLSEKRKLASKTGVEDFIVKWHTVGAALADTDPKTVNELMQIFIDPSSSPSTPISLGQTSGPASDFLAEYYLFVKYMDDVDVTPEEKVDILRKLFDGSTLNFAGKKSRRYMRHGLRRRQGVGEVGLPDTGIQLDDAPKLGHDALAEILGPAGTLDPQEGENSSDVGDAAPEDSDITGGVACSSKRSTTTTASVDQFVDDLFGGELPIDAHADEFADRR
jgi:hypothetical protein